MNISKIVAALNTASSEIETLYNATLKQGLNEPHLVGAAQTLGKANVLLNKAKAKLDAAVEKATPKEKEDKKDAKKTDAKK